MNFIGFKILTFSPLTKLFLGMLQTYSFCSNFRDSLFAPTGTHPKTLQNKIRFFVFSQDKRTSLPLSQKVNSSFSHKRQIRIFV